MSTIVISNGADITYNNPLPGFAAIVGQYWLDCKVKHAEAPKQLVDTPGVDGQAVNRLRKSLAEIEITVAYVSDSNTSDYGFLTDLRDLQNQNLTITTPQSYTLTGCEFVDSEQVSDTVKETGFGTYMLIAKLYFKQLRDDA